MDVTSYLLGKKAGGGSQINNQDKSISITSNGTTTANADSGYTGLGTVSITTNVPTAADDYFTTTVTKQNKNNFSSVFIKQMPALTINNNVEDCINLFYNWPFTSINLSNFDTSNIISMYGMFGSSKLTSADFSSFNTEKVTNMSNMFSSSSFTSVDLSSFNTPALTTVIAMFSYAMSLVTVNLGNNFDTSQVTAGSNMFNYCMSLKTITGHLDFSSADNFYNLFGGCSALQDLPTFANIGKGFRTTSEAHNSGYTLNLSSSPNLTHTSLMNVINGLYDIATAGCETQDLVLGATNLAKLSSAEIAIATDKGWTVS